MRRNWNNSSHHVFTGGHCSSVSITIKGRWIEAAYDSGWVILTRGSYMTQCSVPTSISAQA